MTTEQKTTTDSNRWELLPVPDDASASFIIRLNALGSLYFFEKFVLQKNRLVEHLHKPVCETLERQNVLFMLELPRDHFKAESIDNLIPTTKGFVKMADVKVGDYVFGLNGVPTKVVGVSFTEYRPLLKVTFSTGEEIKCDAKHLWVTDARRDRDNKRRPYPTEKTTELIASSLKCRKEYNHRVSVAKQIIPNEISLPVVPPYTLGAWLGDGDSNSSGFTCNDDEIITRIQGDGFTVTKHKARFRYGILGLQTKLKYIGILGNKSIPQNYLFLPAEQRLELLRGLMDTDGSISKQGQCSFSNVNWELVKQVRTLLCSLGYKPSPIGSYKERLNGEYVGWFHVVTFYAYPDRSPFHLKRKTDRLYNRKTVSMQGYRQIVSVEPAGYGYVKCIKVEAEDGLYLTGEGFIPTHNTTCVTEGLPLWWALPFDDRDEAAMRELGYGDEWIRWMRWAHNPGIRILTISETEENALKMGIRIDRHFESNAFFREVFPEIMPTEKSVWNSSSKSVTHNEFHANGEGTFDYLGVGGALQSRHYERMIEDDLVGKKAIKSEIVMEDTIDYHKLLEGAFDGPEHVQIVVGNRWSPYDLNGWIRENDPDFIIESHSALGGCCDAHVPGQPIFPEEFSIERLERIRRVQGGYLFSHQYLNQPVMEEEVVFRPDWLRYYAPRKDPQSERMLLTHEAIEGSVTKDVPASWLHRTMILDPNHAGSDGRAHHAIVIVGLHPETDNLYLLDVWAASMNYDDLMVNVYRMADKWKMTEFWLETIAAQKYLKYHIEYRNKIEKRQLRVRELKSERSKNAKWTRIDALAPVFEQGKFYVRRDQSAFLDEYHRYTHSTRYPVDVLDALGYSLQTLEPVRARDLLEKKALQREKMTAAKRGVAGY